MSATVEVSALSVHYGSVIAVENASIEVAAGSFAALVGPSGCGKTSLLRSIAGFETPAQGSIRIGGSLVAGAGKSVPPELRQIGMMFQEGALFPHLNVIDNVAFGANRKRAGEMLELVGLSALASRFPHELSGGQQQRVALARALAPSPRVILLDEPFDGLDASLRVRIREEVREILRSADTTAILVTHDQEEALSIADQVSVMHRGRVLQTSTPREIYERPLSVEVAAIVGDAHLIESAVENGSIATPFGILHSDSVDGPCTVRVRSEDLRIVAHGGAEGVVIASHFFGHDVVDEVRLSDGRAFRVRTQRSVVAVGEKVRIALCAPTIRIFRVDGAAIDVAVQRLSAVG